MRVALLVLSSVLFLSGCFSSSETGRGTEEEQLTAKRLAMIEQHLHRRGIRDERVLKAMAAIPRHLFVPPELRDHAYDDEPLPIDKGQTISQPYMVALMSESLLLNGTETVLEIGTGSGYQAAVLSQLATQVYSIEIIPELADTARQRLTALGYNNVTVIVGDGYQGWPQQGPYAAIMVTAAPPQIPQALVDQLAEGGRLVIPVGPDEEQHLLRLHKVGGLLIRENLGPVRFVPLVASEPSKP